MLTGRDEAALKEVAAAVGQAGRKAAISVLDLRQEGAEKPLVEAARKAVRPARHPGQQRRRHQARRLLHELTNADWADGFALKFFAHVRLTREAWPLLKASSGSLVTIAGIGGKEPEAPFTIGSSVNAACVAFTKAMADIGKTDGVQVNSINPGRVETERLWRRIPRDHEGRPGDERSQGARGVSARSSTSAASGMVEDIGSLIAFLASPHGRWLHGATIDIDGGEVRGV